MSNSIPSSCSSFSGKSFVTTINNLNSIAATGKDGIEPKDQIIYDKLLDIVLTHFFYKKIKSMTNLNILNRLSKDIIKMYKKEDKLAESMDSIRQNSPFINNPGESSFFVFPSPFLNNICYVIARYFKAHFKKKSFLSLNTFFSSLSLIQEEEDSSFRNRMRSTVNLVYSDICDFTVVDVEQDKKEKKRMSMIDNRKKDKIIIEDLIYLRDCFYNIKKIRFLLPNFQVKRNVFLNYLMILFNSSWLFENLIEFEINITNLQIFMEGKGKKKMKEKNFYYLIYSLFYLLGKFYTPTIQKLVLSLPYAYTYEINYVFKNDIINYYGLKNTKFLHILNNIIKPFTVLKALSLEFNCIDNVTFTCINNMLEMNRGLSSLIVFLFPRESVSLYCQEFYLKKFAQLSKMRIAQKVIENDNEEAEYFNYTNYEYYLDLLFESFNINMNRLFIAICNNRETLNDLQIQFDVPEYFQINEKYIDKFISFILEIFSILESSVNSIVSFEVASETFFLNGNTNVKIEEAIDEMKMENNKYLQSLVFNMKVKSIDNLAFLFPRNIKYLTILEIDDYTCKWFIKDLNIFSNLESLSFSVRNESYNYEENNSLLKQILTGDNYPQKLLSISLNIKFALKFSDIKEMIASNAIKQNYVQTWNLQFLFKKVNFGEKDLQVEEKKYITQLEELISQKKKENQLLYYQSLGYLQRKAITLALYHLKVLKHNSIQYSNSNILNRIFTQLSTSKTKEVTVSFSHDN